MLRSALAVSAALTLGVVAFASGPAPRTDNRVVCLDLQSGRLMWRFAARGYGTPTLELHAKGRLVVRDRDNGSVVVLNAGSGEVLRDVEVPAPAAASAVAPLLSEVGRQRHLRFTLLNRKERGKDPSVPARQEIREVAREDDADAPVWRVAGAVATGGSIVMGDVLIDAQAYSGDSPRMDQAVLRGFLPRSEEPVWSVDLNARWPQPSRQEFFRIAMAGVEGRLIAQAWGHVFALSPKTGAILWHVDLADHGMVCPTDLPFTEQQEPDTWLWHGGVPIASVSGADGVVLVGYESRLVALDGTTGKHRWNIRTDAFPHLQRPVIANGVLFTWLGNTYREVEDHTVGDGD